MDNWKLIGKFIIFLMGVITIVSIMIFIKSNADKSLWPYADILSIVLFLWLIYFTKKDWI